MVEVGVAEAAEMLGVSAERVRQLAAAARIPARRVNSTWIVDASNLDRFRPVARPLVPRMAFTLDAVAAGHEEGLERRDAYRARGLLDRLGKAADPGALLRSWMSARATPVAFDAQDPAELAGDRRILPSGICAPAARLTGSGAFEGYVAEAELEEVKLDHLLLPPAGRGNCVLHVVGALPGQIGPLVVAADLLDRGPGRESGRALELIAETVA